MYQIILNINTIIPIIKLIIPIIISIGNAINGIVIGNVIKTSILNSQ